MVMLMVKSMTMADSQEYSISKKKEHDKLDRLIVPSLKTGDLLLARRYSCQFAEAPDQEGLSTSALIGEQPVFSRLDLPATFRSNISIVQGVSRVCDDWLRSSWKTRESSSFFNAMNSGRLSTLLHRDSIS